MQYPTFDHLHSVRALKAHYDSVTSHHSMQELLNDETRNTQLRIKLLDECLLDLTHTKIDSKGLELLHDVCVEVGLNT